MPVYPLRGVNVDFPHEAYPCQLAYMEKVIQSCQQSKHAMLESPTGTGKTLCLLCASTSWRRSRPDAPAQKIIYSSRTHSQLSQVMKELKSTSAKGKVKVALLGSRSQLCVHPDVQALNGTAQKHACQKLIKGQSCKYYKGVRPTLNKNPDLSKEIRDIEDLVDLGKSHCTCPYYLSRHAAESADMVMLPYNYLVDPSVRDGLSLINGNLVIFDEAHNLETQCCEASSIDLTPEIWRACVRETEFATHLVEKEREAAVQMGEKQRMDETVREIADMKTVVRSLEALAKSINSKGAMKEATNGKQLSQLLHEASIDYRNLNKFNSVIETIELKIAEHNQMTASVENAEDNSRSSALSVLKKLVKVLAA